MASPQQKVSLAEHLKGFSAVKVSATAAARVLEQNLLKYGPVTKDQFTDFCEALKFLLPLKSFTTRFLVLGLDQWSLLVSDMHRENCSVDAYAISRATGCHGIGLFLQDNRRELQAFEEGKTIREVQSLLDGDRWYYREQGPLQPFEELPDYTRKNKRDRLRVNALRRYFETYTGLTIPNWTDATFTHLFGLERSTKDLQVPLLQFDTVDDSATAKN
jgi:hypothetical protein